MKKEMWVVAGYWQVDATPNGRSDVEINNTTDYLVATQMRNRLNKRGCPIVTVSRR
jgi:hypothetical protein